jgi:hypothetical protein
LAKGVIANLCLRRADPELESFLGKLSIPVTEDRLLEIYHSVLTERGVADYPWEQCRDDYGMALLLPASRLATPVGEALPTSTSRHATEAAWRTPALDLEEPD